MKPNTPIFDGWEGEKLPCRIIFLLPLAVAGTTRYRVCQKFAQSEAEEEGHWARHGAANRVVRDAPADTPGASIGIKEAI